MIDGCNNIVQIGADGRRSQIFLALSTAAEFRDHLSTFSDFYSSLGKFIKFYLMIGMVYLSPLALNGHGDYRLLNYCQKNSSFFTEYADRLCICIEKKNSEMFFFAI